ncbi:MAG: excinuclease ABC subunit UvrC [Candidatus Omnitrophota bacterium]|nr:excinuclease ABC subunit UvrC [Candidatus Omnitrophota bacterium]
MDIKEKVKNLPLAPGIYIMKSKDGDVLYVGKATSLRKRVNSYFSKQVSVKTGFLLENLADIEYIECGTQEQALILEAALIKEKKPKYNISLRDDKSYPYIEITKDKFARIFISRPKKKTDNLLFGPYPKVKLLKPALKLVRRVFGYRSCRNMPKTACLFYHLNLCPAPCIGKISSSAYQGNIEAISKILRGERKELEEDLEKKMSNFAKESKFEEAALARDKLSSLYNLYQGKAGEHELIALKELLQLAHIPLVIEAIDVSSLSGKEVTGSVVVFRDGIADKNNYRRYRIKKVEGPDDYASIREVAHRRYSRLIRENRKMPDLVIIDGGLGHADSAKKELDLLDLKISLIGIAKQNEEVWFPGKNAPLVIAKDNPALHLIQRIRDEAHRFAHKYHLLLRSKKVTSRE